LVLTLIQRDPSGGLFSCLQANSQVLHPQQLSSSMIIPSLLVMIQPRFSLQEKSGKEAP
jgi:hypothetical protein